MFFCCSQQKNADSSLKKHHHCMREDAQYSETATSLNDTNEEGGDINIGLRGGRCDEKALHGSSDGRRHLKRKSIR